MTSLECLSQELDRMSREYDSLLAVLHKTILGEIDLELIEVDLTTRSWRLIQEDSPCHLSEDDCEDDDCDDDCDEEDDCDED